VGNWRKWRGYFWEVATRTTRTGDSVEICVRFAVNLPVELNGRFAVPKNNTYQENLLSPTTKKSKEWTLFRATIDFRPAARPMRSPLPPHALCPVRHMQPRIESHTPNTSFFPEENILPLALVNGSSSPRSSSPSLPCLGSNEVWPRRRRPGAGELQPPSPRARRRRLPSRVQLPLLFCCSTLAAWC